MIRAALLILFALTAMVSNVTHAAVPAPRLVATMHHHQPAQHKEHEAPCCQAGVCVGCAIVPPQVIAPACIAALAPIPAQPARMTAFAGRASLPAVPPPRA